METVLQILNVWQPFRDLNQTFVSRVLWYKPMSWLGQIRSHHRDETWSEGLWQTFFVSCVGTYIPDLTELPLSACGCRKFQIDTFGDHLCNSTVHSGGIFGTVSKRYMTGREVGHISGLFHTTHKV
jgi:hypothetical protein